MYRLCLCLDAMTVREKEGRDVCIYSWRGPGHPPQLVGVQQQMGISIEFVFPDEHLAWSYIGLRTWREEVVSLLPHDAIQTYFGSQPLEGECDDRLLCTKIYYVLLMKDLIHDNESFEYPLKMRFIQTVRKYPE